MLFRSTNDINRFTIITLLIIQICGSIFGLGRTFWESNPYSYAKNASEFLSSLCQKNVILVAENDLSSSAISAYLPSFRFFYLNRSEYGTFTSWKVGDFGKKVSSWSEIRIESADVVPCAYVLPVDSKAEPPNTFQVVRFSGSIWGDDYKIVYPRNGKT